MLVICLTCNLEFLSLWQIMTQAFLVSWENAGFVTIIVSIFLPVSWHCVWCYYIVKALQSAGRQCFLVCVILIIMYFSVGSEFSVCLSSHTEIPTNLTVKFCSELYPLMSLVFVNNVIGARIWNWVSFNTADILVETNYYTHSDVNALQSDKFIFVIVLRYNNIDFHTCFS